MEEYLGTGSVPTLFEYESWINEEIKFSAGAKATVSATYKCEWTKDIVSSFEVLAIPGMYILLRLGYLWDCTGTLKWQCL